MDTDLATIFNNIYNIKKQDIPEQIIGKIGLNVSKGLIHLNMVHRVTPFQIELDHILINRNGQIKLCDFNIKSLFIDKMQSDELASNGSYMFGRFLYLLAKGRHPVDDKGQILPYNQEVPTLRAHRNSFGFFSGKFTEFIEKWFLFLFF
jgi:hypothetical protein